MSEEKEISFRNSKWERFDPDFAEMIRTKHPDIWRLGGNIKGNDQYRKLYPITKRNGVPNSEMEVNALKLREAWVARHYKDFRIAGVIAQIKWLAVGSRGEQYMKNLVKEEILKRSEVKQSDDMSIEEALAHAGVKGMRWGVRNNTDKSAKADDKWAQKRGKVPYNRYTTKRVNAVMDEAVKNMRADMKNLNKDPRFNTREAKKAIKKEKGLLNPENEIVKEYNKAASKIYMKHVKAAAKTQLQISPSGKFKEELKIGKNYWNVIVTPTDSLAQASYSDLSISFTVRPIFDEDGYITDFEILEDELMQSDDMSIEEALAHAGVKGMRWGVRKSAKKQAAQRTSYKKGPKSLSEAELRRRVSRMETEKRYVDLNPTTAKSQAGKSFVSRTLNQSGSMVVAAAVGGATALVGKAIKNNVAQRGFNSRLAGFAK